MTLPRWLRIGLFVGVALIAVAGGTLHVPLPHAADDADGCGRSLDGEGVRIMSAIASRLAASKSQLRLNVLDARSAAGAAEALSSGKRISPSFVAISAIFRTRARSRCSTHVVVLLVAPAGSPVKDIPDLRNRTLGVIGGPANRHIVDLLNKEFDIVGSQMQVRDLLTPDEVRQAVQSKRVHALLAVMPISEKYIATLRSFVPVEGKRSPTLIAINSAKRLPHPPKPTRATSCPRGRSEARRGYPTTISRHYGCPCIFWSGRN